MTGDLTSALTSVNQLVTDIPEKQKGIAYLELSKLFEMKGEFSKVDKVLHTAQHSVIGDWKVFFESVLMYF